MRKLPAVKHQTTTNIAPLVGAALIGAAGGVISNAQSAKSAKGSIAFQREMAQNAHQYEVEDLKKAGLNPILSAGGSGARASGGAQYTAKNVLENTVSTALAARRQKQELNNMAATEALTKKQTEVAQNAADTTSWPAYLNKQKLGLAQSGVQLYKDTDFPDMPTVEELKNSAKDLKNNWILPAPKGRKSPRIKNPFYRGK